MPPPTQATAAMLWIQRMARNRMSLRLIGGLTRGSVFGVVFVDEGFGVGEEFFSSLGIDVAGFEVLGEDGDCVEVAGGVGGKGGARRSSVTWGWMEAT